MRSLFLPLTLSAADIVIYGCTSGGIGGGQARRMGKSVTLVCPSARWTHGGWPRLDGLRQQSGDRLSREFYHRVWLHYESPKPGAGSGADVCAQAGEGSVLPGRRQQTYEGVDRGDEDPGVSRPWLASVAQDGARALRGSMQNWKTYTAKMFIDATYEGDLARAKVAIRSGAKP
jgi:hypothetical protein